MINAEQKNVVYLHPHHPVVQDEPSRASTRKFRDNLLGMTPDINEVLRTRIENGDLVMVDWKNDAQTVTRATWNRCFEPNALCGAIGTSVGFIFNSPGIDEILVLPHRVGLTLENENIGEDEVGAIGIPYSSIQCIALLISKKDLLEAEDELS